MHDRLAALGGLEARFDGPIPETLRRAALFGSADAVALMAAKGHAAFYAGMLRGQLRAIRLRRADGSFYPAMVEDLRLYRREWRRWHARARALAGGQSGGPAPSSPA